MFSLVSHTECKLASMLLGAIAVTPPHPRLTQGGGRLHQGTVQRVSVTCESGSIAAVVPDALVSSGCLLQDGEEVTVLMDDSTWYDCA